MLAPPLRGGLVELNSTYPRLHFRARQEASTAAGGDLAHARTPHQPAHMPNPAPWCTAARLPLVHHEACFLRTHPCLCARAAQMPFGKNKKLSAPRPNKKKVEARDEESNNAEDDAFDEENANEAENLDPAQPAPASDAKPALSPHSVKVQAAEEELLELQVEFEVREEISEQTAAQLTMSQRIYDAKMRRLDVRQRKRKRDGSPFLELERIYKAELELMRAQLRSEEAEGSAHNAEANYLAQQCRVLRLQNAKMQRLLRKHGVRI